MRNERISLVYDNVVKVELCVLLLEKMIDRVEPSCNPLGQ